MSVQGESASVSGDIVREYQEKFKELLKEYEAKNIFNLDETALFYKLLPNRTLCNQAKARGVKSSKERVSVVFCVSYTGEKLPPMIIGKAAMPRSLRGVDLNKVGVKYTNTFKSWMTSSLFQEYLRELNKQMREQKRNILLLVDNAPSHIMDEELTNVKIKFLPKDTTSVLQPLDQGIIRSFKAHYKKSLINYLITMGNSSPETMKGINLGLVVNWVSDAWKLVTEETITNCFRKTGLFDEEAELLLTDTAEHDLQAQLASVKASISVEEYLSADEIIPVYGCSEEELNQEVYEMVTAFEHECEEDDEEQTGQHGALLTGVTREKTLAHVDELRTMMSLATTTSLKRHYQEIISELMGGVERMSKQAKLDFGPAEQI